MAGYILYSSPDEEKNKEVKLLEAQAKVQEQSLQEEYCKLGKEYFEQYEAIAPEEFTERFGAIKECKEIIQQCKDRILFLKKVKLCPYCKNEIPEDSAFCIMCGKKVSETQPQKIENTVTCKFCGTVLPAGSKFCGYCSHSLEEEPTVVKLTAPELEAEAPKEKSVKLDLGKEVLAEKLIPSEPEENISFEETTHESEDEDDVYIEDESEQQNEFYFEEDLSDDEPQEKDRNESFDEEDRYPANTDWMNSSRRNHFELEEEPDEQEEETSFSIDDDRYNEQEDRYNEQKDRELYATTAANAPEEAVRICPACQKRNNAASMYCTRCGLKLVGGITNDMSKL